MSSKLATHKPRIFGLRSNSKDRQRISSVVTSELQMLGVSRHDSEAWGGKASPILAFLKEIGAAL